VQANGFGRDAKAAVVDGLDVGPEELESNGTGYISAFPGGGHVGNVGMRDLEVGVSSSVISLK